MFPLIHLEGDISRALDLGQEVAHIQIPDKAGVNGSAKVQALVLYEEALLVPVQEEVGTAGMAAT